MKLRDLTDRQIEWVARSVMAFDAKVQVRRSQGFFGGNVLAIDVGVNDAFWIEVHLPDGNVEAVAFLRRALPVDEDKVDAWMHDQLVGPDEDFE
jgi:hypothetical protein